MNLLPVDICQLAKYNLYNLTMLDNNKKSLGEIIRQRRVTVPLT